MAARQGFEPRYADPDSAVLPLDDRAILCTERLMASFAYHDDRATYQRILLQTRLIVELD